MSRSYFYLSGPEVPKFGTSDVRQTNLSWKPASFSFKILLGTDSVFLIVIFWKSTRDYTITTIY